MPLNPNHPSIHPIAIILINISFCCTIIFNAKQFILKVRNVFVGRNEHEIRRRLWTAVYQYGYKQRCKSTRLLLVFYTANFCDTRSRNAYQKLVQETCMKNLKFITVSCSTATGQPIMLHGSGHVLDSFCPGMELCSIACKKLVQDWPTHMQVQDDLHKFRYKFFERVSPALGRASGVKSM